jgi:4-amino-4-deoxy-L-arabinose transferase-like glycosyltransferase
VTDQQSAAIASPPGGVRWALAAACVLLITGLVALLPVLPSNIDQKEQPGTVAYMADVADNGAWLVQRLPEGGVATKPPLLHWAGGIALRLFGGGEWVLKAPVVACYLVLCVLVYALARDDLGRDGALVAVAMFAAVGPTYGLAWIARPDMPIALFLTLALLASLKQIHAWREGRTSTLGWIAVFWGSIAMGLLAKGQVALIGVAWFATAALWHRARAGVPLARCRPGLQAVGLLLALGVFGAWAWAAWRAEPGFAAMVEQEVVKRSSEGEAFLGKRSREPWNVPLYVLSRFVPWSVPMVIALIAMAVSAVERRRARRAGTPEPAPHPRTGWAAGYLGLFVLLLMTQPTHRPDHLLPAYAAAAVVGATIVVHASRWAGPHRAVILVSLGLIGLSGLAAPIAAWAAGDPTPLEVVEVATGEIRRDGGPAAAWAVGLVSAIGVIAGAWTLRLAARRRFVAAAIGSAWAFSGLLGVNRLLLDEAARERRGDAQIETMRLARDAAARLGLPIVFHETGYTALQALEGRNDPPGEDALRGAVSEGRGAIVVGRAASAEGVARVAPDRSAVLYLVHAAGEPEAKHRYAVSVVRPVSGGG